MTNSRESDERAIIFLLGFFVRGQASLNCYEVSGFINLSMILWDDSDHTKMRHETSVSFETHTKIILILGFLSIWCHT